MLLVAFAMRGFYQGWNVELERREPSAGAEAIGPTAPLIRPDSARVSSPEPAAAVAER